MNQEIRIRPVSDADWDGITALESRAYTPLGLSEEREALESKVRASPGTCFALDLEHRLTGYLLALPYPALEYPGLARPEETAFRSRNLHLHDLVITESVRGQGLGKRLLHHLTTTAAEQGYEQISLIAVGGSETFWTTRGFAARHGVVAPGSYGADAVYMFRPVHSDRAGSPRPIGTSLPGTPSREEVG